MQETQWKMWEIFAQYKTGKPFIHIGNLHASDAESAIQNARDVYARRETPICLWAVPSEAIVSTQANEMGPIYDPAHDKIFRHPQFYKIPKGVNVDIH